MYHFRNLVFEGGGVKGLGYVGALNALNKKDSTILPNIKRIGGASAGAITAILVGLNYSTTEIEKILMDLNFKNFLDDSWGMIRDTKRLIKDYGWYKGKFFRQWIGNTIKNKTGNSESTFKDIYNMKQENGFKDMYFIGTNLSTKFSEVFSYEHTPDMCVADAVRMSMSIPLFFEAVKSPRGDVYVDGGVLNNYPVRLFDREKYILEENRNIKGNINITSLETDYYKAHNDKLKQQGKEISNYIFNKETLGFRLDSAKEIGIFRYQEPISEKIDHLFNYTKSLVNTIMEFQQNLHLNSDDWQRTIYVDTLGVKTTDFDISDERKKELIKSGEEGIKKYFDWYDKQASTPINKPSASFTH